MKTAIKLFAVLVLALFAFSTTGFAAIENTAAQSDLQIVDINYDDPVAPGTVMPVEIELSNANAKYDYQEVNVKAWLIDGYGDRITDKVIAGQFQIHPGEDNNKVLTLNVNIPEDLETGKYTLFVEASGVLETHSSGSRETVQVQKTVEVEANDDAFFVKDIRTSKDTYYAGDNVDVAVTVMNNGVDDQDKVVVAVAVPELGIEKSLKIFGTLFAGNSQTVYMTFALPKDADAGIFTLTSTASNSLAKASTSVNMIIKAPIELASSDTKVTGTDVDLGQIEVGKAKEIQLAVSNKDTVSKSYEIKTDAAWATITADPVKFDLRPGQTQKVTIEITAKETGKNTADVYVFENGKAVSSVGINADARTQLTTIGTIIVALAFILAAVIVYTQFCRNGNSGSKGKTQHIYY